MGYKQDFIKFMVRSGVLTFGDFITKSGRPTPYFVNTGNYRTASQISTLGTYYAACVVENVGEFDLMYGPAYKGIPLVTTTAVSMWRDYEKDVPYCFNRKEAKDHGEGGTIVGAPLAGRVLIVDDVITAGTAIREALAIIREAGGTPAGIVIALDRQERVREDARESAAQAVAAEHGIPVIAVAALDDLLAFAGESAELSAHRDALLAYRARYGVV